MSIAPEILAKQQEYAARPFAARVESSHFSGTFRFEREADAIDYLLQSFKRQKDEINSPERAAKWGKSWLGWNAHGSYLERPDGKIPARFILFHNGLNAMAHEKAA